MQPPLLRTSRPAPICSLVPAGVDAGHVLEPEVPGQVGVLRDRQDGRDGRAGWAGRPGSEGHGQAQSSNGQQRASKRAWRPCISSTQASSLPPPTSCCLRRLFMCCEINVYHPLQPSPGRARQSRPMRRPRGSSGPTHSSGSALHTKRSMTRAGFWLADLLRHLIGGTGRSSPPNLNGSTAALVRTRAHGIKGGHVLKLAVVGAAPRDGSTGAGMSDAVKHTEQATEQPCQPGRFAAGKAGQQACPFTCQTPHQCLQE